MGMRGLSMKRLEQILNLRQRCQSFAKLEDRYYGRFKVGSYDPEESNRDERPDVCPLLLERSNRIREQRVDQTAHLILAEALGMELKNPAEVADKKVRKAEVDLHGEYKRRNDKSGMPYPRCSVIVLENLERYKMSLGRTKSENSRLMKWAHGKILDKLEDMCRPFGITLMLVDPAFSSHFDARTGLPGVRVNQVSLGFENEYPYNRWIEGKTKAGGETQLAKDIKLLAKAFAEHPEYKGELVLAVEGGKEFVPVLSLDGKDGLINADICAAGNIGHRGIADPQRWDIFPRLRTKQISETEVSVTNWRGWFGKFSQETKEKKSEQRRMRAVESAAAEQATASQKKNSKKAAVTSTNEGEAADSGDSQSGQSSEYPPFFVANPQHDWLPDGDWLKQKAFKFDQNGKSVLAYRQGEYLKRVEQICSERIKTINDGRIHKLSKA
jgi:IS605 OrfB family transposase